MKLFSKLAAAAALVGTAFALAPGARADPGPDPSEFLQEMAREGFTDSPQHLLDMGVVVCRRMAAGSDSEQIAADLHRSSTNLSLEKARAFVLDALIDLCPEEGAHYDWTKG